MDRHHPVLVDPLLCYVSNHRQTVSDQDLHSLITRYYSSADIVNAYERLNEQTARFLNAIVDDREQQSSGDVEAILRIFRQCDRYRINLPEFAVTDLKSLPPPPSRTPVDLESPIPHDSDISSVAHSANNSSSDGAVNGFGASETAASDAVFTRRMLLKIVKELKQLKSLVIDLSVKNATHQSNALDEGAGFDPEEEEDCHESPAPANEEEEKAMMEDDECPTNNSVRAVKSPAPNGDEQNPSSRGSSESNSRTTMTPPRKRGSSTRSLSSIEEAVAKLKARGGGNPSSLNYHPPGPNANSEVVDSRSPSPKNGLDESAMTPTDEKSPDMTQVYCDPSRVKNECYMPFPSARSLAEGLFPPGGVPHMDLVNMMAGMFPMAPASILAAALSPRGARLPPFSTSTPQQQPPASMESRFAAPTSTTPCVSPMIRQQHKEPTVFRSGRSTIPRAQQVEGQKPKKAAKRQDLASPTLSDSEDTRKRQNNELSDGDSSLAESNSGMQGSGKPFVCHHDNCDKRFGNKFLLKKHEFIHTGLRPHQCPYCLKKFNRKDNLLRHKVTHEKNGTTPRRRTCRVFGVKGSMVNSNVGQSELVTASAGSSPSADSKVCLQQRSSSCAPNEMETANRQPTPLLAQNMPQAQSQINLHSASGPNPAEFSLAALASYTALAQSLWPRAALSGVHSK